MGKTEGPSQAALNRFLKSFEKDFGPGSVKLRTEVVPYEVLPTGSLELDYATGVGGLVEGRVYEIWGIDSVGKTSLVSVMMANAQRRHPDQMTGVFDVEQKWDPKWSETLGVDLRRHSTFPVEDAESVADKVSKALDSGLYSFLTVDSVGALITRAEKAKAAEDKVVSGAAGIVTRMVKKAAVSARESGAIVMFVNQVRANIGGYGPDTDTPGGFALKHATTMKFHLRSAERPLQDKDDEGNVYEVGYKIAVKVQRNGVAPRGRTAQITLLTDHSRYGPPGIDFADEAASFGVRFGVVEQSGAWFVVSPENEDGEQVKLQGREKLVEYLRTRPDLVERIRSAAVASRQGEVYDQEVLGVEAGE